MYTGTHTHTHTHACLIFHLYLLLARYTGHLPIISQPYTHLSILHSILGGGILKITLPSLLAIWLLVKFCHQETLEGDLKKKQEKETLPASSSKSEAG